MAPVEKTLPLGKTSFSALAQEMVVKSRFRFYFAVGVGLLGLTFLLQLFIIRRTLTAHQRFEAERALGLIEGRLRGYLDLLRVLPNPPNFLRNLAWLTDELQSDPGLVGVLVTEKNRVLLNTFPEELSRNLPPFSRCVGGYQRDRIFYLCRRSELAPGRYFRLLVAFDNTFKSMLFEEALFYGGLVFLGGLLLLGLTYVYALRLEKEQERLSRRLLSSEKLAAMGRLAAMLAHEIRNPLHTLSMGLQYLWEDPQAAHQYRPLLEKEIQRLSELTSELLRLSRGFEIQPENFSVSALIQELRSRFHPKARARGLHFEVRLEDGEIRADRRWLYRALFNLLANALEAPEGNRIRLTVSFTNGEVRFSVCNTGTEIPEEVRERVFEPFFTTREGGFGLGLYIVRQVAEAHGGRVTLKKHGEEVCFELSIPRSS